MAGAHVQDAKHSALLGQVGVIEGHIDDLEVAWLEQQTGQTGQRNDLWLVLFKQNGATSDQWNDAAYEFLKLVGATGEHIDDLWYDFWVNLGGTIGPNVNIVLASGGSCDYTAPGTDCTAVGTYTANDSGFTNPADTWLWTIEPPVVGVDLTDATLKTCTVTTPTSDADLTFNLKVVATDSVSTDTANRTTTFTQKHTDATVVPLFIGPNIDTTELVQNEAMTPFDVSTRYSGFIESWSLVGTWPAGLSIDGNGVLSGTPTDPVADYDNLQFRATNYVGSTDSNLFTVTILAGAVAPVFSGTVPNQVWQLGVPATLDIRPYFTGTSPSYTLTGGTLPDGMTLSLSGIISGTPTTEETQAGLIVTATNSAGSDVTNAFQALVWESMQQILTIPQQDMSVNAPYSHDFSQYFSGTIATYNNNPAEWPSTITIDPNTGIATGTPTVEETFTGSRVHTENPYEAALLSNSFTINVGPEVTGPAFWALTPDETTYEMLGVKIGTGDLTTTHTADLYAPDLDNVYRQFAANEAVYSGGRVVRNHFLYSHDPSQSEWTKSGGASVASEPSEVDPYGNTGDVFSITNSGGTWGVFQSNVGTPTTTLPNASGFTVSVWVKRNAGTDQTFRLYCGGAFSGNLTATDTWQRFSMYRAGTQANTQYNIASRDSSSNAADILVYGGMLEINTSSAIPSEIVRTEATKANAVFASTNGNSESSNVVTEATGTPLAEAPWLSYYPAATNVILYSHDLTTNWTITGTITRAYDQVGLTGEPNTATLLTRGSGTLRCYVKSSSGIQPLTMVVYAKATGPTDWLSIALEGGTAPYAQFNISDGIAGTAAQGATSDIVVLDDGWVKCIINYTSGNLVRIFPFGGQPDDTQAPENDLPGSVIIGNVESYEGKSIEQVRGLGPIFTTTAAVATDAPNYTFDPANTPEYTGFAMYADYISSGEGVGAEAGLWYGGASNNWLFTIAANRFRISYKNTSDALVNNKFIDNAFAPEDTLYKIAMVGGDDVNKIVQNINGVYGTEATDFKTSWSGAEFRIKRIPSGDNFEFRHRNIQIWPVSTYQEGRDIIDGLMTP